MESNVDYLERFTNSLIVFESCGGSLLLPGVMTYATDKEYKKKREDCNTDELKKVRIVARNTLAATIYLENSSDRYTTFKKEIANDFLKSTNNYPEDTVATQSLLFNYSNSSNNGNNSDSSDVRQTTPDVMFAQNSSEDYHTSYAATVDRPDTIQGA